MAVKRPPNTWVSKVLTLKGFRDGWLTCWIY